MKKDTTVLLFSLGDGICSASVLETDGGIVVIDGIASETIGGKDIDDKLVNYFLEEFKAKHNLNPQSSSHAMRRLRTACENAKKTLSSATTANLLIENFFNNIDFYSTLTRSKFEELNKDFFDKCIQLVDNVVKFSMYLTLAIFLHFVR